MGAGCPGGRPSCAGRVDLADLGAGPCASPCSHLADLGAQLEDLAGLASQLNAGQLARHLPGCVTRGTLDAPEET